MVASCTTACPTSAVVTTGWASGAAGKVEASEDAAPLPPLAFFRKTSAAPGRPEDSAAPVLLLERSLRGLELFFAERGLLFGELLPLPPPSPLPLEVPMGARLPARELPVAM